MNVAQSERVEQKRAPASRYFLIQIIPAWAYCKDLQRKGRMEIGNRKNTTKRHHPPPTMK